MIKGHVCAGLNRRSSRWAGAACMQLSLLCFVRKRPFYAGSILFLFLFFFLFFLFLFSLSLSALLPVRFSVTRCMRIFGSLMRGAFTEQAGDGR